jgi:hypothetical protein
LTRGGEALAHTVIGHHRREPVGEPSQPASPNHARCRRAGRSKPLLIGAGHDMHTNAPRQVRNGHFSLLAKTPAGSRFLAPLRIRPAHDRQHVLRRLPFHRKVCLSLRCGSTYLSRSGEHAGRSPPPRRVCEHDPPENAERPANAGLSCHGSGWIRTNVDIRQRVYSRLAFVSFRRDSLNARLFERLSVSFATRVRAGLAGASGGGIEWRRPARARRSSRQAFASGTLMPDDDDRRIPRLLPRHRNRTR